MSFHCPAPEKTKVVITFKSSFLCPLVLDAADRPVVNTEERVLQVRLTEKTTQFFNIDLLAHWLVTRE